MKSHVSLFAGIGAMDIAAEHAGYTTTHCVEIDPWCRSILALRFPGAELHADVCTVGAAELGTGMDLLSGGFPCQDLSSAGKGAGLDGGRSGLWFEYLRIIGECLPKMVLIENVAVLKSRGLDIVIAGLAAKGYGCWWDCVPALAVGAPHLRDRIWITAVPFDAMPPLYELDPVPFKRRRIAPTGKMPRAGYCTVRGHQTYVYELAPQATIKAAKLAMGAERREDGVTWLTSIDSPLFPTPRASARTCRFDARSNTPAGGLNLATAARVWATPRRSDGERGGRGDLVQQVRGNKATSAHGPLFPTPSASSYGSNRGGAAGRVGPVRHSPTSMARSGEWPRLWPTPHGMSHPDAPRAAGPSGNELGHAINVEERLWPTPRASANELRTTREAPSHGLTHGRVLAGVVCDLERAEGRTVPPPSHSAGSLNPAWVEWLIGLPIGWTALYCSSPVQLDFRYGEPDIPRVAAGVVERKQPLMACGNALVWQVAATRLDQAEHVLGAA